MTSGPGAPRVAEFRRSPRWWFVWTVCAVGDALLLAAVLADRSWPGWLIGLVLMLGWSAAWSLLGLATARFLVRFDGWTLTVRGLLRSRELDTRQVTRVRRLRTAGGICYRLRVGPAGSSGHWATVPIGQPGQPAEAIAAELLARVPAGVVTPAPRR